MYNVCANCGLYRADKEIDPSGPYAICPECGHKHLFRQLPLLAISGASGTGKSAVCQALLGHVPDVVLLDSDLLWRREFDTPETNYRDYSELWLRVCKNIHQSGRPVVLFGAGTGVPENMEPCVERRYFSAIHYLALVCSDEALAARLRARPAWRGTQEAEYIVNHQRFNGWFKTYSGQPPIKLVDTTNVSLEDTAQSVREWICEMVGSPQNL